MKKTPLYRGGPFPPLGRGTPFNFSGRRGAGVEPVPFSPEQISDSQIMLVPFWEAGNSPAELAPLAQNPAIIDGATYSKITDWSGNGRHANLTIGTGLWRGGANGIGGKAVMSAAGGVSYLLQALLPYAGRPLTVVMVFEYTTISGTLFGSVTGSSGTTPNMRRTSGGALDFNVGTDQFIFTPSYTGAHILCHSQDESNAFGYLDGSQVYEKGSAPVDIPSGVSLQRLMSAGGTGSSRIGGKLAFFAVWLRPLTFEERDNLTAWLGDHFSLAVAAGFSLSSPSTRSVFQNQTPGSGVVRAAGTYRSDVGLADLEARWNGGSWHPCSKIGGSWFVDIAGSSGRGTLEVRTTDLMRYVSVEDVSLGRKVGIFGQSNALGSALNFHDLSANLDIAIFDPRPSPMPPMAGSLPRNIWNPAFDKSCWPTYLASRTLSDAMPFGVVRFAIGSTKIAFWEPDAAPDAAGFGYTGIVYLLHMIDAVIRADGRDPNTYTPSDGLCCEEVFLQIGETDASAGTTKASFKTSLVEIAGYIFLRLGVPTRVSVLQELPVPGYVPIAQQIVDIQNAVVEAVNEESALAVSESRDPRILQGPDFRGVILEDPPGDGVHFYTDVERTLQGDSWAVWP